MIRRDLTGRECPVVNQPKRHLFGNTGLESIHASHGLIAMFTKILDTEPAYDF
jgi:hypothetical protein